MKLVDTNVLLYAVDRGSPRHESARRWLDDALAGQEVIGLPWVALLGLLRISTDPRVYARALDVGQASLVVERWLSSAVVMTPEPTSRHLSLLHGLLAGPTVGGREAARLTTDAHLAALALEYGATLVTFDGDFRRWGGPRRGAFLICHHCADDEPRGRRLTPPVVGFGPDLAATETLFTSLLLQSTRELTEHGSKSTRWGTSRTRSFRQSFLTAFADRVGQRLEQAAQQVVEEVSAEEAAGDRVGGRAATSARGGGTLVHVLEQRRKEVDATVDQLFGALHSAGMPIPTDHEGWSAGVAAADRADLARGARVEQA